MPRTAAASGGDAWRSPSSASSRKAPIPWIRAGERLYGAATMPINPATLTKEFAAGPWDFLRRFGETGLHAATAWLLVAPFLGLLLFFAAHQPLRVLARHLASRGVTAAPAVGPPP